MSTTTDKTQRMIFLALPFIFVLFVIQFPAGLLVYWITTNVWTIGQQAIIKKRLGPLRPPLRRGREGPGSVRRVQAGEYHHGGRAREEEDAAEGAWRGAQRHACRPATEVTP